MDLSISPAARHSVKRQLKDGLVCFSLANLCLLRCWYDLEHLRERGMNYYRRAPADQTLLEATLIAAVLMAFLFWLAWKWVERNPTPVKLRLAQVGFLLLCIYPLESVRRYWNQQGGRDLFSNLVLFSIEILLAVGVVLAVFGHARIVHAARRMALVLTLLFPALMVDFGWGQLLDEPASAFEVKPPLPMLPSRPGLARRVVWIVFDELDQRLVFDLREPKVDLPNVDRLRADSFVASHATQTATFTMQALPSLLSGEIFSRVVTRGADELEVYSPNAPGINWRDAPNVFRSARELGVNASIAGWHHPYCRMLGDSVVRCLDVSSGHSTAMNETTAAQQGLWKTVGWLFTLQRLSLEEIFRKTSAPLTETAQDEYIQRAQLQQYFQLRDRAYQDVADPRIDFVFLHLPVPHLYGIYNRERGDFTLDASRGYTDNLALMDRTWGEIRHAIEQAGLWDATSVIITSDHGLRPAVWRGHMGWTDELERLTGGRQSETVPFIVKLAGHSRGVAYDRPFSNVVCGSLGLAILRGDVRAPDDIAPWLEERTDSVRAASFTTKAAKPAHE
jgi:hypothetical protein